jgi:replication factor C small subunit
VKQSLVIDSFSVLEMQTLMEPALWTEKYRPKSLGEIIDQEEIVSRLLEFVKRAAMPHCLFAGPPGTGKTTAALCLAHDLFGERFQDVFMELNASDERGIDVVRTTVKEFARMASLSSVPFKILVLDEADNMTSDAQSALRRTMEKYTETCRFILCCNYSGRIIEPIQSRCALFRFTPLPDERIVETLHRIAKNEGLKFTETGLKSVVEIAEGDLRKAINTLQAASSISKAITEESVYQVVGRAKPTDIHDMLNHALKGDFIKAREELRHLLVRYGLSGSEIVRQIHSEIFRLSITEKKRIDLIEAVGEIDFRLVQGGDEEVQLSALLARLAADA